MSAEKGGALVRSPPGLVESYTAHVGGSAKWGETSAGPHLPPQKQQQPQRNATVTKIPSGSYKGSSISPLDSKKKLEANNVRDPEEECRCEGWARARQLEHDLDQLKRTHDVILKGLHLQIEEMKQKNRDLTFQLLMGPFANSVQIDVPLSPENDVTPPKEGPRNDRVSISNTIIPSESGPKGRSALSNDIQQKEFSHRQPKAKTGDPRLARSLDLEILEEEADEMRTQLEDERAKNKYLLALTEDLKRQIREETGSWYPPLLTQKRGSLPIPYKPIYDARKSLITELGVNSNSFRLPQIPYQNQRVQPLDQEQEPQQSRKPPHLHPQLPPHQKAQNGESTQDSPRKKQSSKLNERNKDLSMSTTLPAIVRTGESQQRRKSQGPAKSGEGETSDRQGTEEQSHPSRGKHHPKGKTKHRQYPNDPSPSIQENREYSQRDDGEVPNYRQKHSNREHRQQKSQHKNKVGEQNIPHTQSEQRPKHLDKQRHHQESKKSIGENSQHQSSPKRNRSGSFPRVRPASQGRSSEREKQIQNPSKSHNKPVPSTSKTSKSSVHMNGPEDGSIPIENGTSKQSKYVSSKGSQSFQESSSSLDALSMSMNSEGGLASSSTSATSNSRTKHRGRANKRGGKKNKKETQEPREEFKDH